VPTHRARQHAPWSASKVQTALRCAREFHYRYVEKIPEPETMPETRIGKAVHSALEHALQGEPLERALDQARGKLVTHIEIDRFDRLEPGVGAFLRRVDQFRKRRRVQRQLIEYPLAIREDLTAPTQFFSGDAFYRGVFDAAYLYNDEIIAVIDHKSGQRWTSLTFKDQLEGYAVLVAAGFRSVRWVYIGLHWVAERAVDWSEPMSFTQVLDRCVPHLLNNIEAAALAVDDGPRPIPSDWCLRCSYRSICPAGQEALLEPVDPDDFDYEWDY
jgi:CRISPR/Cas system-associated exonuclease Cas4 (RecB family)